MRPGAFGPVGQIVWHERPPSGDRQQWAQSCSLETVHIQQKCAFGDDLPLTDSKGSFSIPSPGISTLVSEGSISSSGSSGGEALLS